MEIPNDLDAMFDSKMPGLSLAMVRAEGNSVGDTHNGEAVTSKVVSAITEPRFSEGESVASGSGKASQLHAISGTEKADYRMAGGGKQSGVARGKLLRCSPARNPVEFDPSLIGSGCQNIRVDAVHQSGASPASISEGSCVFSSGIASKDADVYMSGNDSDNNHCGRIKQEMVGRPCELKSVTQEKKMEGKESPVSNRSVEFTSACDLGGLNSSLIDHGFWSQSNEVPADVSKLPGTSRSSSTRSATSGKFSSTVGLGRGHHLKQIIANSSDVQKFSTSETKTAEKSLDNGVHQEFLLSGIQPLDPNQGCQATPTTRKSNGIGRGKLLQHLVTLQTEAKQTGVGCSDLKEKSCRESAIVSETSELTECGM